MKLGRDLSHKIAKFKSDVRARISLNLLMVVFLASLPAELLCNVRPILLVLDGKPYFPILVKYSEKDFGGVSPSEPDYKSEYFQQLLKGEPIRLANDPSQDPDFEGMDLSPDDFEDSEESIYLPLDELDDDNKQSSHTPQLVDQKPFEVKTKKMNSPFHFYSKSDSQTRIIWEIWPPVRYDYKYIPTTSKSGVIALAAPYETEAPSSWEDGHYLGTDDRGRDVLARLIYGFRVSMVFGLALAVTGTILGCLIGSIQGYFGGWVDLIGQRLTEIWGSMPRLYLLIILSSFFVPSTLLLFLILNLTAWMGISAYIRAEFLKARNLEYVKGARAMGVSNFEIIRRHILPNSLTPVITFFPFEVTAGILALVSLDYLNLGVPSPAPSMGELLAQGKSNLQATWIILPTFILLTGTLTLLTFIGDGIRNAFDPRKSIKS